MQLFIIIVAGCFVCICTCFCFPHLLTMCPPSAKSHESIVNSPFITLSKEFIKPEEFSRFTISARNCVVSEVTNRIVLPNEFNEDQRSNFADAPSFLPFGIASQTRSPWFPGVGCRLRSLGWEVTFLDVSPRAFFGLTKA